MQLEKFGWNKESLVGLFMYQGIGAFTFAVDLAVLYPLVRFGHVYYPIAVGVGMTVASLVSYFINRSLLFTETKSTHGRAMFSFFLVAALSLAVTVTGTVFLVHIVRLHLYIARTLVGVCIGISGYFLNAILTFRMHEK